MQKDSTNHVGFAFKDGEIMTIVKDSSAARNGILTDHYLTEVNGQNVIGLKVRIMSSRVKNTHDLLIYTHTSFFRFYFQRLLLLHF